MADQSRPDALGAVLREVVEESDRGWSVVGGYTQEALVVTILAERPPRQGLIACTVTGSAEVAAEVIEGELNMAETPPEPWDGAGDEGYIWRTRTHPEGSILFRDGGLIARLSPPDAEGLEDFVAFVGEAFERMG